ncbi:MAG: enoyl-CoA hydratase/isomerase family protein [Candidatus Thermoplasmatota archaeon]|nr:enoyl-CoA hydratase/isomerase family protein [Candidatus Thermoplasmatota archaeon]MCL5962889.1 enoyl-CoA hydratase/isomerase family protein [Candidatus Thermoplasmatota archaeon]
MYKNFKKVSFWAENKLGIIAMDNGNSNVMDAEMLSEMLGALSIAMTDNSINAVVITGTKRTYSTGLDICEKRFENPDDIKRLLSLGHTIATTVLSMPKIVVSLINGNSVDAGFELALLGDIIISKNNALAGFPGLWYGMPHFIATPSLLSAIYGKKRYYGFLSKKIFKIEEQNIADFIIDSENFMNEAKRIILELPYNQSIFKGEVFNNLRLSMDFERYDNVAIHSKPDCISLKNFITNKG